MSGLSVLYTLIITVVPFIKLSEYVWGGPEKFFAQPRKNDLELWKIHAIQHLYPKVQFTCLIIFQDSLTSPKNFKSWYSS